MCEKTNEAWPWSLSYVPDHMKTQNMCIDTARIEPYTLEYVPDWYKTYQMCLKQLKNSHGYWNLFQIILRLKIGFLHSNK